MYSLRRIVRSQSSWNKPGFTNKIYSEGADAESGKFLNHTGKYPDPVPILDSHRRNQIEIRQEIPMRNGQNIPAPSNPALPKATPDYYMRRRKAYREAMEQPKTNISMAWYWDALSDIGQDFTHIINIYSRSNLMSIIIMKTSCMNIKFWEKRIWSIQRSGLRVQLILFSMPKAEAHQSSVS